jgi:hypothetical protein
MSADLRPMDTAPEGKRVLVKADDGEWYVAEFVDVDFWTDRRKAWLYADCSDTYYNRDFTLNPVGWLPLPD